MGFKKTAGDVAVTMSGDSTKLDKSIKKAQSGVERFKSKATAAFKKFGLAAAAIGGVVLALRKLTRISKNAIGELDLIGKTARRVGLDTTAFQEWSARAEAAGVSQETFNMSVQRFSRRVGEAKLNTGELLKSLETLDIDMKDGEGNFKTTAELLDEYAEKVSQVSDKNQQLALTTKAFDSEGAKMIEVLRQTKKEASDIIDTYRSYGGVIDAEVIAKAEVAATKLGLMEKANKAAAANMAVELAPMVIFFEKLENSVLMVIKRIMELLGLIHEPLDERIKEAGEAVKVANDRLKQMYAQGVSQAGIDGQMLRVKELAEEYTKLAEQKIKMDSAVAEAQEAEAAKVAGGTQLDPKEEARLKAIETYKDAKLKAMDAIKQQEIVDIDDGRTRDIAQAEFRLEQQIREIDELQIHEDKKAELRILSEQKTAAEIVTINRHADEEIEDNRIKAMEKAEKERQKVLDKAAKETAAREKEVREAIGDIATELATAAADGSLDFDKMFEGIIAGAIRAQIQIALMGKAAGGGGAFGGGGGGLGGLLSMGVKAGMAYYTGGASLAAPGGGAPVASQGGGTIFQNYQPRAGGGRVYKGQSYTVGELRAERFTPDTNGTINAHPGSGGTAPSNIKVNINNSGEPKNAQVKQSGSGAGMVIDILLEDMEQNGKFSRHLGNTFGVKRSS